MEKQIVYTLYDANKKRWIAAKGWVTVKDYAHKYLTEPEALAVQKHLAKNNVVVELQTQESEG